MHRSFAGWLSEKLWRAGVFSVVFGLLSPQGLSPMTVAAGAVPALMTLRHGVSPGANAALAGFTAVSAVLLGAGQPWDFSLACAVGIFILPWGLAVLLRRTGSLNLCFQITVLAMELLLGAIYIVLDDPLGTWQSLVAETARAMASEGLVSSQEELYASLSRTNWGTYVAVWLLTVLGALFLSRWWQSLLEAPGAFGAEFRALRLGTLVGLCCGVVVVAKLVLGLLNSSVPVVDALASVAMLAVALQGLAVVHGLKAAGRIGRGWLAAVYGLLVVLILF